MKIPTKKELLELQKRYRTDKKIGEVLGGVDAYLVAYWRRKKGIPPFSYPKYTKNQIMELWEQYGSDTLAGDALDITGNAFRYWRNKYGIKEKPQELKLEQMQLPLPGIESRSRKKKRWSYLHKILYKKGVLRKLEQGIEASLAPDRVFIDYMDGESCEFLSSGHSDLPEKRESKMGMPEVYALYNCHPLSERDDDRLKAFCNQIRMSSPSGGGQILNGISDGDILPGEVVISNVPGIMGAGAVGALALTIDKHAILNSILTNHVDIPVFDVVRITLLDTPPRFVEPLDIVLYMYFKGFEAELRDSGIEYAGDTVANYNLDRRFTLCYLSRFLNCRAAGISCCKIVEKRLRKKALTKFDVVASDPGANYRLTFRQSVLEIEPMIAVFNNGRLNVDTVREMADSKIDTVFTGFYSGGMRGDLAEMASILGKRKIPPSIRMLIRPATSDILSSAIGDGSLRTLVDAGCTMVHPSPDSIDAAFGAMLPEMGSLLITDPLLLNFIPDRYPHPVYVTNHQVAVSSALNGAIIDPRE